MSKRGDAELIADLREAISRIESYTQGLTYEQFMKNIKDQDAVVRNLEIIGEASKNISSAFKKKYPQIPWSDMARVRDRLIHHYFGVNLDIVWDIIKVELPSLVLIFSK
jgi:uncharacterized protein with HEPN domain